MDVNKEWANKVSKAEFVERLEKSELGVDLGELWESLQVKKPKEEKSDKK